MPLTSAETWGLIAAVAAATVITRFTPFLVLGTRSSSSPMLQFLGKMLPPAMMGLLVAYCFKDVGFASGTHGVPELVAALVTVVLHLIRGNMFLSIGAGTAVYMVLVQSVFA